MSWPIIPKNVVFDLDDAQNRATALSELFYLKDLYPKFKCTLFAIPDRCSEQLLSIYHELDWLELAVHGWNHHSNWEAEKWTKEECLDALNRAEEKYPHFVKGFKAPGWKISDGCYQALLEREYWVADNVYNDARRPAELPAYLLNHPWCIHGHTWNILGVPKDQQNGIYQLIYERELKFDNETEFHFVSEIIEEEYGGVTLASVSMNDAVAVLEHFYKNGKEVKGNVENDSLSDNKNRLHREEPRDSVEVQRYGDHESGSDRRKPVWGL